MEEMFSIQLFRAIPHLPAHVGGWSEDGKLVRFKQNLPTFHDLFTEWTREHLRRSCNWSTFKTYLHTIGLTHQLDPACDCRSGGILPYCKHKDHWYMRGHPDFTRDSSEESIRDKLNINPTSGKPYAPPPALVVADATSSSPPRAGQADLQTQVDELKEHNHDLMRRLEYIETSLRTLSEAIVTVADDKLNLHQQHLQVYRVMRGVASTLVEHNGTSSEHNSSSSSSSSSERLSSPRPFKQARLDLYLKK